MAVTDNQPINVGNIKALFGALAELTMGGGFLDTFACVNATTVEFTNNITVDLNKNAYIWSCTLAPDSAGIYLLKMLVSNTDTIFDISNGDKTVSTGFVQGKEMRIPVAAGKAISITPRGTLNGPMPQFDLIRIS